MNTPKHIDLHVIFYEDLRDDLRLTIQKVIKFLHEVNGNRFIQSEEETNQRLDCLIEVVVQKYRILTNTKSESRRSCDTQAEKRITAIRCFQSRSKKTDK